MAARDLTASHARSTVRDVPGGPMPPMLASRSRPLMVASLLLVSLIAGPAPAGERAGAALGTVAEKEKNEHPEHANRPAPADVSAESIDEKSGAVNWFEGGRGLYVPPFYDSFKNLD